MVNGKKLLASILVGAMVITGSPVAPVATVAAANSTAVEGMNVKVGDAYFPTIKAAMESSAFKNDKLITLTADITEDVDTTEAFDLDLAGHTLTGNIKDAKVRFASAGIVKGKIDSIKDNLGYIVNEKTKAITDIKASTYTDAKLVIDEKNDTEEEIAEKKAKIAAAMATLNQMNICVNVETEKKDNELVPVLYTVADHQYKTSFVWTEKYTKKELTGYDVQESTQCKNGCHLGYDDGLNKFVPETTETKATCDKDGKIVYVAEKYDRKESKTIVLEKTGHSYPNAGSVVFNWPEGRKIENVVPPITVTFNCENEKKVVEGENTYPTAITKTATVTLKNKVDATCLKDGSVSCEATVVGPDGVTYKETETLKILKNDKTPHVAQPSLSCPIEGSKNTTSNLTYKWKFDDEAKGYITCDVLINRCIECGAKIEEADQVVYDSFTVKADDVTNPEHKKGVWHGTIETYKISGHKYRFVDAIQKRTVEDDSVSLDKTVENGLADGKTDNTVYEKEFESDRPAHTISVETYTDPGNCTTPVARYGKCSVCEKVDDPGTKEKPGVRIYEVIAPAPGHTYNQYYTVTKPATCKEEGKKTYTCTVCKSTKKADQKTESIPKIQHKYVANAAKTVETVDGVTKNLATVNITGIHCSGACGALFDDMYNVPFDKLVRKDGECGANAKYALPASYSEAFDADIEFTSANEKNVHNFEATWNWDMKSYENPFATVNLKCKEKDCATKADSQDIIPASDIKFDVVEVKPTCTEKGYKEVTATATKYGVTYTDKVKLESPDSMSGHTFDDPDAEGSDYYNKSDLVSGDYENKQINLTCKKCGETVVAKASLKFEEAHTDGNTYVPSTQTLTATINSKIFKVSRTVYNIANIDDEKTVWVEKTRLENEVPYIAYGSDATNVILYSTATNARLVKDKDYTIEIDNKNAGVRNVTIKGIGQFYGTKEFPVVIEPKAVTITLADTTIAKGAALPASCVKVSGVVAGDDLKVKPVANGSVLTATYEENANYTVTVKNAKLTVVTAAPKAQSITTKKLSANYKVAAVKKAAKTFSIGATCTSKKAVTAKKVSGSKKITVSSTGKVKIAKGTKKGTYTAKVKLTAPKTSSYKAATKTVKVTVKVK